MWLLSCSGDLLGGRRQWLRPGSTHLLGRTSGKPVDGERVQFIDGKSVSRKHLLLRISPATPGDSSLLNTKAFVEAVDQSKSGTLINDQQIKQETKKLEEGRYTIRLGSYEQHFTLEWKPVVFTFTNLPKKTKSSDHALAVEKEKLGSTGIKLITEYITNKTTHVVAQKRNTAPGLQALTQARWLVADSFVDALVLACTQKGSDADGQPNQSALEADFDRNWPKEDDYIVPTGGEPTARPNHYLRPDPSRSEVFHNFTFVFLSPQQHDQLLAVVTGGGGKALLFDFKARDATVRDVTNFVKDLAGKKKSNRCAPSQEPGPGGIVIVRVKDKEEGRNNEFMRDLDLALDQRSIEQSEFLDAILLNDASDLRRSLLDSTQDRSQEEHGHASVQPERAAQETSSTRRAGHTEEPNQDRQSSDAQGPRNQKLSAAASLRNRRMVTKSRFQGFGDFDPSQIVRPSSEEPDQVQQNPSQSAMQDSEGGEDLQEPRGMRKTRKRPAAEEDEEIEDGQKLLDRLLPGAQAMKKRRLEALENGKGALPPPSPEPEAAGTQQLETAGKGKKGKKDTKDPVLKVDVKAEMRARKERQEEARRLDEESLKNTAGVDIEHLEAPSTVEFFSLPVRPPRESHATQGEGSENWNPAWNGRKNFKAFRSNKKGAQSQLEPRVPALPKVRVRLEDVPRRGNVLDDDYWLQPSSDQSRSQSQSHPRSLRDAETRQLHEDSSAFTRRLQRSREIDAQDAAFDDDDLLGPGSASTGKVPSQTRSATSQTKAAGKRPAALAAGPMGPPPKKAKSNRMAPLDDSDDDPTKFRRKRR